MKLPNGVSEADLLGTIEKVCKNLSHKFKFGSYTAQDMQQEGTIIAIKSLDKWDGVRPLENFLYSCVHNGLFNFKRNNYQRPDKPCLTCPFYDPHCIKSKNECSEYADRAECELYTKWIQRNSTKKNIVQPIDISNIHDEHEDNMKLQDHSESVENNELWELIDKHLDIKLRADYVRIKNGVKVPKQRRTKVEEAIIEIMREHHGDWSQEG